MLGAFVFDIADAQVLDDVVGAVAIMGVKVNDSNRLKGMFLLEFDGSDHESVEGAISEAGAVGSVVKATAGRQGDALMFKGKACGMVKAGVGVV